ncbi:MAG TPA: tetratricopeptide repeat protein [Ramlibacter sp.]|nr:tetratricopeptide repeat protein [Ramlibacter sp.]
MKRFTLAGALLLASTQMVAAQPAATPKTPAPLTSAATPAEQSALDAELFYEVLLGELNARGTEPATGYSLILDAARKTKDPALYQRAVDLAFQARSGDAALQAAQAWKQAYPDSRDANRYVLQILIALNRVADSAGPLREDLALAGPQDRNTALALIPRNYARVTDKKLAASVVQQAIADYLNQPATASAAWTTVGRMRLVAGDQKGAIEAAQRGQAANPAAEGPALLGIELMGSKQPEAEALVRRYMDGKPLPEMRMAYARELLEAQRYPEAERQLEFVTKEKPGYPEAWLVQGTLQLQNNQDVAAEASLKRYLDLAQAQGKNADRSRGEAQAYLSLSRIAERRKDFAQASAWLDHIQNAQDLIAAQQRRASILAREGKLDEARKLIRSLPERNEADARNKLMAEVQLLRDNKQYKAAYDLLGQATAKPPVDADLLYEQAMLADKIGDTTDMERLLREVIAKRPDYQHAYNALGYSFAERNVRLPEAKELIQKALSLSPDDPFITDSLGWVEYRMGNKTQALKILQSAYKAKPDADIAAHLGEVLWSLGQRDRAESVWKEGLLLDAQNDTLLETLKRLRAKP